MMDQPKPKPIIQSKTARFNVLLIIAYPLLRQLVTVLLNEWGLILPDSDVETITNELVALIPDVIAILPVVVGNIWLRLVTASPAAFRIAAGVVDVAEQEQPDPAGE